ncbi:MAG TPA: glutaminyl-peptide cyclotransferase [Chitinophagaceae bacterium]|nr:glutaminyl-peptide cyclotransferase [Chitinophagaceae bacterium]
MRYVIIYFLSVSISCTNTNTANENNGAQTNIPSISYTVIASYPHDTSSFTQGLVFYNGKLLESTGNYGKSKLLLTDIKTGKALKTLNLDSMYFGEGLVVLNDTVYQLTWKEKVVHVYTKDLKKIKEFKIKTDGWGITTDGTHLIVSDGTSNLYYYEPSTFRLLRTQGITENGSPAPNLNELEYINGFIYANQWQYNYILKIDPSSGEIIGKLDLRELGDRAKAKNPNEQWLNGIAYDSASKKIYVTGKYWPELYEISFSH